MIRSDLPEVLEIEAASAKANGIPVWSEAGLVSHLKQHSCVSMVATTICGRIAGYILYDLRRCSLRVLRIAVAPELRRHGVGSALLNRVKSKLSSARRTKAVCVADERALDLHLLLRASQFMATSIERNAFSLAEDKIDGYRFEYSVEDADLVMSSIMCDRAQTVQVKEHVA
jgi:ribosomal protein S18 acetylase RimI-like enzyme